MIKYYWKARDQRSKSVLLVLPPDTTENNPISIIHHLQSCHFLWFFILWATEFQGAHLPCSRLNLGAFLKHSTYLRGNENIELCGVARAFARISKNGLTGFCPLTVFSSERVVLVRLQGPHYPPSSTCPNWTNELVKQDPTDPRHTPQMASRRLSNVDARHPSEFGQHVPSLSGFSWAFSFHQIPTEFTGFYRNFSSA